MSRKRIREDIAQQLNDCPTEVGPALKLVGGLLDDKWHDIHGQTMSKEEREARGKDVPLAAVDDVDIRIHTHGKVLVISRDNPKRPGVKIPMGMSDRMNTATMPREWMMGIPLQALISVFDNDPSYAWKVIEKMNEWIDAASVETESGGLKIDQDLLPQPKNKVLIAEMMASLKRTFRSNARGAAKLNLTLSVEDIPTTPTVTPVMLDDLVAIPVVEDAPIESELIVASHTGENDTDTTGTGDEDGGVSSSPTVLESRQTLSNAIIDALGMEGRTIGYIRKALIDMDEQTEWKPRLDAMIKSGQVVKEGKARACRYYTCEAKGSE
jgi:hypothetical protein